MAWIFASPVTWALMPPVGIFFFMVFAALFKFVAESLETPTKASPTVTKVIYRDRADRRLTDREQETFNQIGEDVRRSIH